jgi:hypothetical protein
MPPVYVGIGETDLLGVKVPEEERIGTSSRLINLAI